MNLIPKYREQFQKNGMNFTAESDNGKRMEILEVPSHKFFFGVQFHPEFSSRPGFPEQMHSKRLYLQPHKISKNLSKQVLC